MAPVTSIWHACLGRLPDVALHAASCRYVDPVLPLGRYDWLESYCRLLQHDAAAGMFRTDAFLGCAELAAGRFAVVTSRHLLAFAPEHANATHEAEVRLCVLGGEIGGGGQREEGFHPGGSGGILMAPG